MVATDAPQSGEPELVPAAEQVGAEAVQEVVVSDDASEVEEALSRPSSVPCYMQEEGRYSGRDTQGSRQEESHLSNVTTSYTPRPVTPMKRPRGDESPDRSVAEDRLRPRTPPLIPPHIPVPGSALDPFDIKLANLERSIRSETEVQSVLAAQHERACEKRDRAIAEADAAAKKRAGSKAWIIQLQEEWVRVQRLAEERDGLARRIKEIYEQEQGR